MDATIIDGFTKSFAQGASRRQALRMLGGALAGGLAGLAGLRATGAAKSTCRRFVLSGGPGENDPIHVDDDLTVYLNGNAILRNADQWATPLPPLRFRARTGDRLRVVAEDVHSSCRGLSPLYLRCADGGRPRLLSRGVEHSCPWGLPGIFFDRTFRI